MNQFERLRYLLWLTHPCLGKYGDDGEMQCSECRIDFKRDTAEHIERRIMERGRRLLERATGLPEGS